MDRTGRRASAACCRSARAASTGVRYGLLNDLLDVVGADERHPLAGLLDVLGELVSAYEAHEVAMPAATPREVLRLLMQDQRTDAGRSLPSSWAASPW